MIRQGLRREIEDDGRLRAGRARKLETGEPDPRRVAEDEEPLAGPEAALRVQRELGGEKRQETSVRAAASDEIAARLHDQMRADRRRRPDTQRLNVLSDREARHAGTDGGDDPADLDRPRCGAATLAANRRSSRDRRDVDLDLQLAGPWRHA